MFFLFRRIQDPSSPKLGGWVIGCALIHIVILLVVLATTDTFPKEAPADFLLATELASGRGFTIDGIHPSALRDPGYPFFLAPAMALDAVFGGHSVWLALFGQVIFYSLATWFVARAAPPVTGVNTAVISLIFLNFFWPVSKWVYHLSPICLICVALGIAWSIIARWDLSPKAGPVIFAAFFMSIAGFLCTPLIPFLILLPIYLLWKGKLKPRIAVVFAMVALSLPAVWTVRNAVSIGVAHPGSVTSSSALYRGNANPDRRIDLPKRVWEADQLSGDGEQISWFLEKGAEIVAADFPAYLLRTFRRAGEMVTGFRFSEKDSTVDFFAIFIDPRFLAILVILLAAGKLNRLRDYWVESAGLFFVFSLCAFSLTDGTRRELVPAFFLLGPIVVAGACLILKTFKRAK